MIFKALLEVAAENSQESKDLLGRIVALEGPIQSVAEGAGMIHFVECICIIDIL